ncbi:hypothatical protein [Corynebacterium kutscheri]|nr:MazG nucleotide pyrophosphohydrolase domain-containing protein [Corynebacterium kutscheri]AKE41794.1 MazG nucleotide pyrophosphohydrolase family protein [Corynebacterium kutscheri]VEH10120.1 hypothatical protein [Corynebacterium kutscheri]VEH80202.1 hypothatical protein [Corynebacterium kutscheri]
MIVLLLDSRWPTLIPFDVLPTLKGNVEFSDEVPIKVRWHFGDVITKDENSTILVSTNVEDPRVLSAIADGAQVIEVPSRKDPVYQSVQVMRQALSIGEWEQSQTHESLLSYLHEEVQEFVEAVQLENSEEALKKELSDIFLQVLFHSEIADRRGSFDFEAVAQSFVSKMQTRSPYLFDGTTALVAIEEQERLWELGKQSETASE